MRQVVTESLLLPQDAEKDNNSNFKITLSLTSVQLLPNALEGKLFAVLPEDRL